MRVNIKQFIAGVCTAAMIMSSGYGCNLQPKAASDDVNLLVESNEALLLVNDNKISVNIDCGEVGDTKVFKIEPEESGSYIFDISFPNVDIENMNYRLYEEVDGEYQNLLEKECWYEYDKIEFKYEIEAGKTYYLETDWSEYNEIEEFQISMHNMLFNELYSYEIENGEAKIIAYKGAAKRLELPNEIEGCPVVAIGDRMIRSYPDENYGNDTITEIIVPDTVLYIDELAFMYCSNLREIYIPASVNKIEEGITDTCPQLEKIVVDSGNETYTSGADNNYIIDKNNKILLAACNETLIPDGVERLGWGSFSAKNIESIELPDSLKSIGYGVFEYCKNLESISIPDNVEAIESHAFAGCESLSSIKLPNSLKEVSYCLFLNCCNLESVELPNGLVTIADAGFTDTKIRNLYIPESVEEIEKWSFGLISSLEKIEVDANNRNYDSRNDCNAIIDSNTDYLLVGSNNTVIPDGVVGISEAAFEGREFDKHRIAIPNTVETIEEWAFNGSNLDVVVIPESVKEIGDRVFSYDYWGSDIKVAVFLSDDIEFGEEVFGSYTNSKLKIKCHENASIIQYAENNISDYEIEIINENYNPEEDEDLLKDYSVSGSEEDEKVIVDKTPFENAVVLEENTALDASITEEGHELYYKIIPDESGTYKIHSIGTTDTIGWLYCDNGEECSWNDDSEDSNFKIVYYLEAGETYYLKVSTYNSILGQFEVIYEKEDNETEGQCVHNYEYKVDEEDSDYFIWTCTNCGESYREKISNEDATGFKYSIEAGNAKITGYEGEGTDLIIPAMIDGYTVTSIDIGYYDIENRDEILNMYIPETITSIEKPINCPNLQSIVVSSRNEYYDSRDNCNAIIDSKNNVLINGCVNSFIPYGVVAIEYCAFLESNIEEIVIPNSVTYIGQYAFQECSKLKEVALSNKLETIRDYAFYRCDLTELYIPATVTFIEEYAFSENYNLKTIVVDSNNQIYDSRENCNAIIEKETNMLFCTANSYKIPDSVTKIGNGANNSLTVKSLVLSDNITEIGGWAFRESNLKYIVISENVKKIDTCAFLGNNEMKYAIILADDTNIEESAFECCRDDFVIKCHEDSTAKAYAEKLGISYEIISDDYTVESDEDLKVVMDEEEIEHIHNYMWGYEVISDATCGTPGEEYFECECGEFYYNEIPVTGKHFIVVDNAVEATCTEDGLTEGSHCSGCGKIFVAQNIVKATGHTSITTTTKATTTKDGSIVKKCSLCGDIESSTIIYYPKTVTLSIASAIYTGSAIKPTVTVNDSAGNTISASNYTVSYTNNTAVGTATVKLTFKGNYSGSISKTFKINPKSTTIGTPVIASDGITVKWTKNTSCAGYYIYRSVNGASYTKVKTITSNATVSWKDGAAKTNGNKYQYKIIAYKTVSGTTYTSAASAIKTIYFLTRPTVTLANQASAIKVSWGKNAKATGYYVYKSTDGGKTYKKIKTVTSNATVSYTDTAAKTNGTKYMYKVEAYKTVSGTTYKSAASAVKTTYFVSRPTISGLTNNAAGKMLVKWARNAKASGYQIQYSTSSSFTSPKSVTATGTTSTLSKTIGSLTKGKTYYVSIRSYKTVGSTKFYSAWSASKSFKITK